ncbi:MAG: hypothetical protein JWM19_5346, partial [Actinomycetia bacterium]|nr:hypothetical protein [Actinomycetes bacterium]
MVGSQALQLGHGPTLPRRPAAP